MTTARTLLRLVMAGVMVNVLVAACVVNNDGGDNDDEGSCEPNSTKDCTCSDGTESTRKCNASGTAYGSCVCDGSSAGGSGSGSEGGAPTTGQAGETNTAGTPGTTAGGETGSTGGVPSSNGGTPSETNGGAGGADGGNTEPLECQDPADDCEACYFSCCDDWVACFNDQTCLDQFNEILVCIDDDTGNFSVDDLEGCANTVGTAGGPWSDGLDPKTVTMINCLGGDPQSSGWADEPVWGGDSCNNLCFNVQ